MRVVLCTVALFIASGCYNSSTSTPTEHLLTKVDAMSADAEVVRYTGVVVASQTVDVAPRVGGVIVNVTVRAGDPVARGQVLAEMDPVGMREELRMAQASQAAIIASTRQAEISKEDAVRRVEVESKAVEMGVSPTQSLQDAQFAIKHANAAVQSAFANQEAEAARVRTARERLANATLRAGFDGRVAIRYHDAGDTIAANTPILKLVSQSQPRLMFAVPPEISLRLTQLVTADIGGVFSSARIVRIAPELDAASGMVFVEADFVSATTALQTGRPVTVSL